MHYPVDTHSHTIASTHAYSTLHDYLAEAKRKGIRLFANTDHGPAMADAPHEWHFINLSVWPRVIDGVGLLRGVEANIQNEQGEIDCTARMLAGLDLVLAGFHEPVFAPADRATHTRALINCMQSGLVHIISHPGNPKFPIDIEAVVRAAVECDVALEVNNASFSHSRVGSEANCRAIVEAARDLGAWLSLGSDAHVAFALGEFGHSQQLIDELGFPRERLLNRSPRQLLDFLERRGQPPIPEFAGL